MPVWLADNWATPDSVSDVLMPCYTSNPVAKATCPVSDLFECNTFIVLCIADATAYSTVHFDQENGSFVLNTTCVGNESRLLDCQYTVVYNCSHDEDAGISCKDECEFSCTIP